MNIENHAQPRQSLRELVQQYYKQGDITGWFEALYRQEQQHEMQGVPWGDLQPNQHFVDWTRQKGFRGEGKRALVVGCGLGDDAEELSRLGFQVTAFDIAPTAVAWCRQRFANSTVEYTVADALALPDIWEANFDFVLEIYTLQVFPEQEQRQQLMRNLAACLVPGGKLLLICRGRDEDEPAKDLPWPLTRSELTRFQHNHLAEISFEDFVDQEPRRRFRALYHKQ